MLEMMYWPVPVSALAPCLPQFRHGVRACLWERFMRKMVTEVTLAVAGRPPPRVTEIWLLFNGKLLIKETFLNEISIFGNKVSPRTHTPIKVTSVTFFPVKRSLSRS